MGDVFNGRSIRVWNEILINFIAAHGQTKKITTHEMKVNRISVKLYSLFQFNMYVNVLEHSSKINNNNRIFWKYSYKIGKFYNEIIDLKSMKERKSIVDHPNMFPLFQPKARINKKN